MNQDARQGIAEDAKDPSSIEVECAICTNRLGYEGRVQCGARCQRPFRANASALGCDSAEYAFFVRLYPHHGCDLADCRHVAVVPTGLGKASNSGKAEDLRAERRLGETEL